MRSQVTGSLLWLRQRQAHQALPTCPAPMLPALPEPVAGLRQRLAHLEAQLAAAGQGRAEQPHTAGPAGGAVQRTQQGRLGSAGQSAAAGDARAAERAAAAALAVAEQQLAECQRESGATRNAVAKQAAAAASAKDAKAAALAEASWPFLLCCRLYLLASGAQYGGADLTVSSSEFPQVHSKHAHAHQVRHC